MAPDERSRLELVSSSSRCAFDELAREMRALTGKMTTLMVAVVGVVVAAVRL